MSDLIPNESEVVFDDEAIRLAAKRKELPLGWHKFIVDEVQPSVVEDGKLRGTFVITLKLAALPDPDDPESRARPYVYDKLRLPIANPRVDGHKPADWMYGMTAAALRALFDPNELLRSPRSDDGDWWFDNEKINPAQIDDCKQLALKAAVELSKELFFQSPEALKDRTFYGKLEKKKAKNSDREFTNITARYSIDDGLPEGEDLVDLTDAEGVTVVEVEAEVVPEVQNKKKAKKKAV